MENLTVAAEHTHVILKLLKSVKNNLQQTKSGAFLKPRGTLSQINKLTDVDHKDNFSRPRAGSAC